MLYFHSALQRNGFYGCCVLVCFSFFSSFSLAQAKVIANETVPVQEASSLYLKRIYAMQVNKWPDGHAIKVFVLPSESDLHKRFTVSILGIQSYQLDRLWSRLIFTGTGKASEVVKTQEEMLKRVRQDKGAIGYVDEDYKVEGVKVLSGGAKK